MLRNGNNKAQAQANIWRFRDGGDQVVLYRAFISLLHWLTLDVQAVSWTQETSALVLNC